MKLRAGAVNPSIKWLLAVEFMVGSLITKLEWSAMRWKNTRLAVIREVLQHEDALGVK